MIAQTQPQKLTELQFELFNKGFENERIRRK